MRLSTADHFHGRVVLAFVFLESGAQRRKGAVSDVQLPALRPLSPFRLSTGDDEGYAAVPKRLDHAGRGLETCNIDHGDWNHVDDEPLEVRPRGFGSIENASFEEGRVEENNRSVEAEQQKAGNGRGIRVTVAGVQPRTPRHRTEDLDLWARNEP